MVKDTNENTRNGEWRPDCPHCGQPCAKVRVSENVTRYECSDCHQTPGLIERITAFFGVS